MALAELIEEAPKSQEARCSSDSVQYILYNCKAEFSVPSTEAREQISQLKHNNNAEPLLILTFSIVSRTVKRRSLLPTLSTTAAFRTVCALPERHVVRIDEDRTTKKVLNTQPIDTRRKGRPNLRWIDGLKKDLLVLRTKKLRTLAGRRLDWKRFLEKANAHSGLLNH
ncbi:uncharacterized protein TNCV_4249561 [Trichonephila clavipes]|nr:uncharacterized protein TNCV_4249561 [Trichonephila clavipes]